MGWKDEIRKNHRFAQASEPQPKADLENDQTLSLRIIVSKLSELSAQVNQFNASVNQFNKNFNNQFQIISMYASQSVSGSSSQANPQEMSMPEYNTDKTYDLGNLPPSKEKGVNGTDPTMQANPQTPQSYKRVAKVGKKA